MICIVDYGVGNLFSLLSSFEYIGSQVRVSSRTEDVMKADGIVLPGVGAFGDAADKLKSTGLWDAMLSASAKSKPILGICLGMQMLFSRSFEGSEHEGLGLIEGDISPLSDVIDTSYKIPHIGWNPLDISFQVPILEDVKSGDCVYFVHSYYAKTDSKFIAASAEYGIQVPGVVANGNVLGCQFHPEKSGEVGLKILRSFDNFVNINR